MATVELLPVIEHLTEPRAGAPLDWLVLSADASDETIAAIVDSLALYNDILGATLDETLGNLESHGHLVVSGGIRAIAPGFDLVPSCCCGLESWRDWYGIEPGGQSPWLGHDPAPYVDCTPDEAILWTDGPEHSGPSLSVSYADLSSALAEVQAALTGFVGRLEAWLAANAPGRIGFAAIFAEEFAITCEAS